MRSRSLQDIAVKPSPETVDAEIELEKSLPCACSGRDEEETLGTIAHLEAESKVMGMD